MGMGTWGMHCESISADNLKKICPEHFNQLDKELSRVGSGWGDLAQGLQFDCLGDYIEVDEDDLKVIKNLWGDLAVDFEKKTGLTLSATHYDEDSGDRYDDANDHEGMIFTLGGVYQMTPAAEKIRDMITHSNFTIWG